MRFSIKRTSVIVFILSLIATWLSAHLETTSSLYNKKNNSTHSLLHWSFFILIFKLLTTNSLTTLIILNCPIENLFTCAAFKSENYTSSVYFQFGNFLLHSPKGLLGNGNSLNIQRHFESILVNFQIIFLHQYFGYNLHTIKCTVLHHTTGWVWQSYSPM